MNSHRNKLLVMVVAFLMSLTSLSLVVGTASASLVQTSMGNFTFAYETTNGTIFDLNYTNANYTVGVADSIITSGKNAPLANLGPAYVNKTLQTGNATLFVTGDLDMLLISTTNSNPAEIPSITVNLPGPVSQVVINSQNRASMMRASNPVMDSFLLNSIYRMQVGNGSVYYFSNSPSTLTNANTTIVFQNSSFTPGSSLIVGTTPSASIKYSLDLQNSSFNLSLDPLLYNATSGRVTGTYLSMYFDAETGIITDYTNLYTGTKVFDKIYSTGNGTFGDGFISPMFPGIDPLLIGSVFYYANSTAIYQIHNNIATSGNFFLSNGTAVFDVAQGLNISTFNPIQSSLGPNYKYGNNYSNFSGLGLGYQYMVQAAPTILTIYNDTFRGQLFIQDGAVSVIGQTVSVTTTSVAHMTFIAQVWFLQAQLQVRNQLQYAIQHGIMGAVLSVGPDGSTGGNLTAMYNNSFQLTVQNVERNRVQIQLQSTMQHGTNIAIFIPNQVMGNNSQFTLYFDNQQMTMLNSMDSVLNSTNQSQAMYYLTPVNNGSLLVVNIPHFTVHTLTINATSPAEGNDLLLYGVITAVIVIGAGTAAYIMIRRGRRGV